VRARLPALARALSLLDRRGHAKRRGEFAFWESRLAAESELTNDHYEDFFTVTFGLLRADPFADPQE
jgi:hypothetical protein